VTQERFVGRREESWIAFERLVRGGRKNLKKQAAWFPRGCREITQDLNTAKAHGFDPSIIERLNALALEGNALLYRRRSFSVKKAAVFIAREFPRALRSCRRSFGAAMLLFFGIGIFSGFLCVRYPGMVYEILGEDQAWELEQMYDPESYHYLSPRDVTSDADMFGFYIYNNISIAFRTFAGGILAGFGSVLILCLNAVFLGAAGGHVINAGFGGTFFPFVIAHGAFELTAIVISAQAGLLLGYRLFVTRGLSRPASLREAGKTALPLICGAALMLVIAACIEAFWSSKHRLPPGVRYGAGAAMWVIVALYFIFAGREKK
jgi:uncharacterized membrane protein SpoIIM required for sporulation